MPLQALDLNDSPVLNDNAHLTVLDPLEGQPNLIVTRIVRGEA